MRNVATGVLLQADRVLLTQRGDRSDFPWMWECPGGKAEDGESVQEALQREMAEEVGLRIPRITTIPPWWVHDLTNLNVRIHFWVLRVNKHWRPLLPQTGNVRGLGWFTWEGAAAMPNLPGNVALYTALRNGELKLPEGM